MLEHNDIEVLGNESSTRQDLVLHVIICSISVPAEFNAKCIIKMNLVHKCLHVQDHVRFANPELVAFSDTRTRNQSVSFLRQLPPPAFQVLRKRMTRNGSVAPDVVVPAPYGQACESCTRSKTKCMLRRNNTCCER